MILLFYKLLILNCIFHTVHTVKIGISKPTEITTTTIAPLQTEQSTAVSANKTTTTTITTTEELTDTSLFLIDTTQNIPSTTTTPTLSNTTIKYFQVPTLPPKTSKPKVVKVRPKTTTTTTEKSIDDDTADDDDDDDDNNNNGDNENNLKKTKTTKSDSTNSNSYYCSCNLLTLACDINCCCDTECSAEALQVFDCNAAPKHSEFRTRLEDFQYQHGLPSCRINDGWLCVFRSNVKVEQEKAFDIQLDTNKFYKWPSLMLDTVQSSTNLIRSAQYYKFGEPLQLINVESLEVKNFELPYHFINSRCQIKEPIKHLKSTKWQCQVHSLKQLQENQRRILELINGSRLLQAPLEQTLNAAERAAKNALDIKIKRCLLTSSDQISCKDTNSTELEKNELYPVHIDILFKHNFTHLNECTISLKEIELKSENHTTEFWQTFRVHFELHNTTNNEFNDEEKQAVSGALGYLQGEPIIMAKFMLYNESMEVRENNIVLNYFHPNATRWRKQHTLQLPFKHHGLCQKNFEKQNLINYGISVSKQCLVRLSTTNSTYFKPKPSERNFTAICVKLQEQAVEQLLVANFTEDIWISQLGKPENNTATKWCKLMIKEIDFAPPMGSYNAATESFTCQNMLLDVIYEFQIGGNFIEQNVPHQQLVKQATLTFGRRHDLEFLLTEPIEVPLTVSVMFYDYKTSVERSQIGNTSNSSMLATWLSAINMLILIITSRCLV